MTQVYVAKLLRDFPTPSYYSAEFEYQPIGHKVRFHSNTIETITNLSTNLSLLEMFSNFLQVLIQLLHLYPLITYSNMDILGPVLIRFEIGKFHSTLAVLFPFNYYLKQEFIHFPFVIDLDFYSFFFLYLYVYMGLSNYKSLSLLKCTALIIY